MCVNSLSSTLAWKWTEAGRTLRGALAKLACILCISIFATSPIFSQDTLILHGDTIRIGELEWGMERDWRSRRDLISDNKELYGEHVRILLKYHKNKMVAQMLFGYVSEDSGFVAHGPARYFLESGILLGKRYFQFGQLQGPATDFHKSGEIRVQSSYDQGLLHGPYKTYFENGQQELDAFYDYDSPIGRHQAWYSNGQRKWVELYEDGLRAGPDTSFYETGTIEAIAHYHLGIPTGNWAFYHRNGTPWTAREFEEGKLTRVGFIKSKEGRPLEIGTFLEGDGWLYIYNDEGLQVSKELYRKGILVREKTIKK